MTETNRSLFKKRAAALAVASCLSLAPWVSEAAGLGKLTVYSGLGQPLRAELELGAGRDEMAGMTARLAPVDAFKQAGVDYASALTDLRFAIDKRANGQSVIKVSSIKPVNEPFLDFLVELNWPSGRLVREYTFLLDPPEIVAKGAKLPVSVAEAKVVETIRDNAAAPVASSRSAPRQPSAKASAEPQKTENAGSHVVQPGETLRKIAGETKYDGVSLEQMLVGLFKNNPDAFMGKNINRLKAGAILGLPDKDSVSAVPESEAKAIYVTQARDWNSYRQKLAASSAKAPAREESATQVASGKITAKVEEKAAPAEQGKDRVKIAKTELAAKGSAADKAAGEADQIAKEKALKEAQERLSLLEKNVNELQKLVEMKNQKLAELQQQSAGKKEEAKPLEAAKPAEPVKPVEAAKPAEEPKAAEPAKEPPAPVQPAEEAKPADVKPPEPPKPVAPPEEKKKPVPPPMPEPEEEGFVDALLSDPLPLAGGAGVLALLAGYFMVKRRREQNPTRETTTAPGPSSLGPNSVFRVTGGQSVDTGNTAPQTGDFSQTGPGTIDTDEVDPVAEADVYMAYGRDTQAEEILLEALQKDPQRTAIHAKLLEIYANRKSVKQFETLASELYAQTGGAGAEWEKVAALGAGLDPNNPLYSSAQRVAPAAFNAEATMVASLEDIAKADHAMPDLSSPLDAAPLESEDEPLALTGEMQDLGELPVATKPEPASEPELPGDVMSLDFDLGAPAEAPMQQADLAVAAEPLVDLEQPVAGALDFTGSDALDFDLGAVEPPAEQPAGELHVSEDDALNVGAVDFDLAEVGAPAVVSDRVDATPDFSPEGTMVMPSALDLGEETYVGGNEAPADFAIDLPEVPSAEPEMPAVDFDLDMNLPAVQAETGLQSEDASTATMVNPLAVQHGEAVDLAATTVAPGALNDASLEFDVDLADSVSLGQPMEQPKFDIGSINLDLANAPEAPASSAGELTSGAQHDAQWDEVNTKLDLAKAYEEMGDLEGARELLQEVVGEGPDDLVAQARSILARIGE